DPAPRGRDLAHGGPVGHAGAEARASPPRPRAGSSGRDEHKFSFRNAGAPISKLRLVGVDPLPTSTHLITSGPTRRATSTSTRSPHCHSPCVEYEDGLGNMDAMTAELRDGHTFEVLDYDSDKL